MADIKALHSSIKTLFASKLLLITLIEKTPHPINGTRMATGDEVESIINANFCLEILYLSNKDWNTGPTINGVPRSEKKIKIPANQALICADTLLYMYFIVWLANATPPPEY